MEEESGGGGDGERTHTPTSETAGVVGNRPGHCARGEYGLLALEAPAGDQADRERVVGEDATAGSPVEIKDMRIKEEDWNCAPLSGSQQEWKAGVKSGLLVRDYCAHPEGYAGGRPRPLMDKHQDTRVPPVENPT